MVTERQTVEQQPHGDADNPSLPQQRCSRGNFSAALRSTRSRTSSAVLHTFRKFKNDASQNEQLKATFILIPNYEASGSRKKHDHASTPASVSQLEATSFTNNCNCTTCCVFWTGMMHADPSRRIARLLPDCRDVDVPNTTSCARCVCGGRCACVTCRSRAGGAGGPAVSGCPSTSAPRTPAAHPTPQTQPCCRDFYATCLNPSQKTDVSGCALSLREHLPAATSDSLSLSHSCCPFACSAAST